jgi:sortase (surface protein transpeptidase)
LIPNTLVIPKIGVRAVVEQVAVDSNGNMAVPQKVDDVGWYAPGVAPGQDGDAVIDGHLDWYGVPQAVFYNLNQLQPGDEVDVISQDALTLRFSITDSISVQATDRPAGLFATAGSPRLTLITCAGDWNPVAGQFSQRLLVDASYVGIG